MGTAESGVLRGFHSHLLINKLSVGVETLELILKFPLLQDVIVFKLVLS